MRDKRINPFTPGNGLFPPYLAGREKELRRFRKSLEIATSLPQNMVISGLRGTGKTVLLLEYEKLSQRAQWLFVKREFNARLCNINSFIFAILTDILFKTQVASLIKKTKKPKIGFLPGENEVINSGYINKLLTQKTGTLEDRFESILSEVYPEILSSGHNGLVFLYDEFHSIEDEKYEEHFPLSVLLETFSHLQQKGMHYFLVLSGLPPLFPNLVTAKTYAERMFSVQVIGELDEVSSKLAIERPLKKTACQFEEGLINALVKETKGYPYFLQFYAFQIIENIPKSHINYKDFVKIKPFVLNQLDESFFTGRFERTSSTEREVLFKIIDLGDEMETSQIRERIKKSRGALNLILRSLVEKGIMYRVRRGTYAFTLPLFKEFLKRMYSNV